MRRRHTIETGTNALFISIDTIIVVLATRWEKVRSGHKCGHELLTRPDRLRSTCSTIKNCRVRCYYARVERGDGLIKSYRFRRYLIAIRDSAHNVCDACFSRARRLSFVLSIGIVSAKWSCENTTKHPANKLFDRITLLRFRTILSVRENIPWNLTI